MRYKRGYMSGHRKIGGGYTKPRYFGHWLDIDGNVVREATREEVETQEEKRKFFIVVVLSAVLFLAYSFLFFHCG